MHASLKLDAAYVYRKKNLGDLECAIHHSAVVESLNKLIAIRLQIGRNLIKISYQNRVDTCVSLLGLFCIFLSLDINTCLVYV